ncbi:MAG: ABC transporter substrate-binding protein [Burkholderiales bacterium]|nr:ABC transporter substrate-binding protein [Burkholderiales bacterium]
MRASAVVCFSALGIAIAAPAVAQEKIVALMNFTIQGDHGPFFVAKEKGYFREAGLDVEIQRGFGSGDTVKKVVAGVADIGFADPVPIIQAVAEGQQVRAIMGGYMQEPCALYSTAEGANIKSPKEMEGRTIGGPPADICIVLLQPVMERAGADWSKVKVQNMDAPTRIPLLAAGKIDAAGSFAEKEVLFEKAIKQAGKTMVTWPFSKYIEKYSVMTIAGKNLLSKPETLRKFTLALLRGYEDAIKDPDAAAATILKAHPEFDRDYILASARTIDRVVWDPTTKSKGLGTLDAKKMAATIDLTAKYWKLAKKPAPEEIFTNEYIEWAHAQRKR